MIKPEINKTKIYNGENQSNQRFLGKWLLKFINYSKINQKRRKEQE